MKLFILKGEETWKTKTSQSILDFSPNRQRSDLVLKHQKCQHWFTLMFRITTVRAVVQMFWVFTSLIWLAVAIMTTHCSAIAFYSESPSVFRDDSSWNWIKIGRRFIQLRHFKKHFIANCNGRFLSAAFNISMRLPLEQLCPTQMAYWAKNYVTILTRAA